VRFEGLNHVDLCFVVDTTGSMGPFVEAAKQHLLETLRRLRGESGIDLRVGLVEYRDHPPEDRSYVTRDHPLTGNLETMEKVIGGLKPDGGGDAPEAVYDGVHLACSGLEWRSHSCRFALLVGDAPPHGYATPADGSAGRRGGRRGAHADHWPEGCPCGLTPAAVTAAAESVRVTLHALCMSGDATTAAAFRELAAGTGGQSVVSSSAGQVMETIDRMLAEEFRDLQFDATVLERARALGMPDGERIAAALGCPILQAAAALARLGRRGFLETGRGGEPR
jgi:hypothetical protein